MIETHVITCFLKKDNKILILKRSEAVGSYNNKWAGISGYIEDGNTSLSQALIELKEEVGLERSDLELLKIGAPLEVIDDELEKTWIVHPFLFRVINPDKIKLDWEHSEYKWIDSEAINDYSTVPALEQALVKVS